MIRPIFACIALQQGRRRTASQITEGTYRVRYTYIVHIIIHVRLPCRHSTQRIAINSIPASFHQVVLLHMSILYGASCMVLISPACGLSNTLFVPFQIKLHNFAMNLHSIRNTKIIYNLKRRKHYYNQCTLLYVRIRLAWTPIHTYVSS